MEEEKIDSGHGQTRNMLMILGPLVLAVGLLFMAVGLISFFSAFGSFDAPPRYFWCCFVGMPLMFIGSVICKFAFIGKVIRYIAAESAPVSKDTFNYMAAGTKDGVRDIAGAIREGFEEEAVAMLACPNCDHKNDSEARFCDQCGNEFAQKNACSACSELNDSDAKFCNGCGAVV